MYIFMVLWQALGSLRQVEPLWATQPPQYGINFEDFDKEAIVEEIIKPGKCGRVRYRGSWWQARCVDAVTIAPGETVHVVCRHALTLIVRPIEANFDRE